VSTAPDGPAVLSDASPIQSAQQERTYGFNGAFLFGKGNQVLKLDGARAGSELNAQRTAVMRFDSYELVGD
jgi:hypothetical protein